MSSIDLCKHAISADSNIRPQTHEMPRPDSRSSTTEDHNDTSISSQTGQPATNAMTAEVCASSILFTSTLTCGEYDFLSSFFGPITEQRNSTMQSTLEGRILRASSVSNAGMETFREHPHPNPCDATTPQAFQNIEHTPEPWVLPDYSEYRDLDAHWHEPSTDTLLGPIIDYLKPQGTERSPKDENTSIFDDSPLTEKSGFYLQQAGCLERGRDSVPEDGVSRRICLRDTEHCFGF